eukprot:Nk52_evm5s248 gene=Nk52_evmTU5s248
MKKMKSTSNSLGPPRLKNHRINVKLCIFAFFLIVAGGLISFLAQDVDKNVVYDFFSRGYEVTRQKLNGIREGLHSQLSKPVEGMEIGKRVRQRRNADKAEGKFQKEKKKKRDNEISSSLRGLLKSKKLLYTNPKKIPKADLTKLESELGKSLSTAFSFRAQLHKDMTKAKGGGGGGEGKATLRKLKAQMYDTSMLIASYEKLRKELAALIALL